MRPESSSRRSRRSSARFLGHRRTHSILHLATREGAGVVPVHLLDALTHREGAWKFQVALEIKALNVEPQTSVWELSFVPHENGWKVSLSDGTSFGVDLEDPESWTAFFNGMLAAVRRGLAK